MTTHYDPLAYMAKVTKAVEESMTTNRKPAAQHTPIELIDLILPWSVVPQHRQEGKIIEAAIIDRNNRVVFWAGYIQGNEDVNRRLQRIVTAVNAYDSLVSQNAKLVKAGKLLVEGTESLIAEVAN